MFNWNLNCLLHFIIQYVEIMSNIIRANYMKFSLSEILNYTLQHKVSTNYNIICVNIWIYYNILIYVEVIDIYHYRYWLMIMYFLSNIIG